MSEGLDGAIVRYKERGCDSEVEYGTGGEPTGWMRLPGVAFDDVTDLADAYIAGLAERERLEAATVWQPISEFVEPVDNRVSEKCLITAGDYWVVAEWRAENCIFAHDGAGWYETGSDGLPRWSEIEPTHFAFIRLPKLAALNFGSDNDTVK